MDARLVVEEGSAFAQLSAGRERWDVVVIGGGQAGLSVGYHLARRGVRFVILDQSERIGDVWRRRWDSLRLFTFAAFDGLDGMPFPAPAHEFPTKDQMADYLEAYARRFRLPVRSGVRVEHVSRLPGGYLVRAGGRAIEARQVVVAMAKYQTPQVPRFSAELRPDIVQLHAGAYRNPGQLRPGPVLIVGAGNSGSEIAKELAPGRRVWLSGRHTGDVPFRPGSFWGRWLLCRLLLRVVFHRLLTIRTALGRKLRPKILHVGGPLIRVRLPDLRALGVEHVSKTLRVEDGLPVLEDGRRLEVANVIWCTGFRSDFSRIDLPIFDDHGEPRHVGGVVPEAPGLYFVGLHFLYSLSSGMVHGVGRDARRIAARVADGSAVQRHAEPAAHVAWASAR